ncbi:MAG: type II toxin-antitoxin system HipA family toxin [Gammaproteobacteria bacterium]|nr:type II toxin-antitoxin system HipA family toxin [Gammaproteobacteria bacterium]
MARNSKHPQLEIWMNTEHVGQWRIDTNGRSQFRYTREWMAKKQARPISLSMPLRHPDAPYVGQVAEAYFDNLLPDSREIRERIQARYHTASMSPFELLKHIGRDCIGAVQLLSTGEKPVDVETIQSVALDDNQVAQLLKTTVSNQKPGQDVEEDFRISLAGAQEKTALLKRADQWHRPLNSTPTTHILKLPIGTIGRDQIDLSTSVENEWLCGQLVRQFDMDIANMEIADFAGQRVLVVERFDRKLASNGKWWMRLPQEDMCQATTTPPHQKYESEGGPGILDINKILLGSSDSLGDRRTFFKAQVLFWMLCAPDGHAKNFSIALLPGGQYKLTPLYDVLSAYPLMGKGQSTLPRQKIKMAMASLGNNKHYKWNEITLEHWFSTVRKCGGDNEKTVAGLKM